MYLNLLFIFGILMMLNGIFLYKQTKESDQIYSQLRKKGKLITSEKRTFIFAVTFIMAFAVDENGRIVDAVKISGLLPFQQVKVKRLPYCGQNIHSIDFDKQVLSRSEKQAIKIMAAKNGY